MKNLTGHYGVFEFDPSRDCELRTQDLLSYFDRKYPIVYSAMKHPLVHEPVVGLRYIDGSGANSSAQTRQIGWGRLNGKDDRGGLIHELVHLIQNYPYLIYDNFRPLVEGIADFYRITLSDDQAGDLGNSSKQFLRQDFDFGDEYDCGSEFIGFLRWASGDSDFVIKLDDALRRGVPSDIESFFQQRFRSNWTQIRSEYVENRSAILGSPAELVERYNFFTIK